jgi:fibronectin type 3 domain-containing protein
MKLKIEWIALLPLVLLPVAVGCISEDDPVAGNPLSPPTNLSVSSVTDSEISLTWTDNSTGETGFSLERAPGGTTSFAVLVTLPAGTTTHTDSGLTEGAPYCYRVQATNATGGSTFSNTACGTTGASIPTAPTKLTVTSTTVSQINLSWTDQSTNEEGFKIERAPGTTTTFAQIATVGAGVTTFSDTGLGAGLTFTYRVRAFSAGGDSAYSNTIAGTTDTKGTTAPSPPSNLVLSSSTTTQIVIGWTDNSGNEDGFKIERAPGTSSSFSEIETVGANVTTYANTGLTAGSTFTYRVRAFNSGGDSPFSNTIAGTTATASPSPPSNLVLSSSTTTQIVIGWTDNSGNEDGFKIERAPGTSSSFSEIETVGANVTTFSDTGLGAGLTFTYRVRAYNAGGNSAYSNTIAGTTGTVSPSPPSNLVLSSSTTTQIVIGWTDNSSNEDGFKIERAPGTTSVFTQIATVGADVTTYTNIGLAAGTTFTYRVRAFNAGGNSPFSNTIAGTTATASPSPPSNLVLSSSTTTQIVIGWTDNSSNEEGFKIERAPGTSSSFSEIETVGANVTTFSDAGLGAGLTFTYRVRAFNAGGNSAYSNTIAGTTGTVSPSAPSNLVLTSRTTTQIVIHWTDNSSNETGFRIERAPGTTSNFTELVSVAAGVVSYTNGGLDGNQTFTYRVRAFNASGDSTSSNPLTAKTLVSFAGQVHPLFTSSPTCAGGCHSGSSPAGGLKLTGSASSVFPAVSARVNVAQPCDSLILKKPSRTDCTGGAVSHTGGTLWPTSGPAYQTILTWIQEGAANN